MEHYLRKLIEKGENQLLDFKYCVSDSRKIARTLTAFANSTITLSGFRKIARIPVRRAEAILANLLIFRVLVMKSSEKGFSYELNSDVEDKG